MRGRRGRFIRRGIAATRDEAGIGCIAAGDSPSCVATSVEATAGRRCASDFSAAGCDSATRTSVAAGFVCTTDGITFTAAIFVWAGAGWATGFAFVCEVAGFVVTALLCATNTRRGAAGCDSIFGFAGEIGFLIAGAGADCAAMAIGFFAATFTDGFDLVAAAFSSAAGILLSTASGFFIANSFSTSVGRGIAGAWAIGRAARGAVSAFAGADGSADCRAPACGSRLTTGRISPTRFAGFDSGTEIRTELPTGGPSNRTGRLDCSGDCSAADLSTNRSCPRSWTNFS